jgi:hypothetical protein
MGVSPFQGWPLGWLLRRLDHEADTTPGADAPALGKEADAGPGAGAGGLRPYAYPRDEPMPPRRMGLRRKPR